MIVHLAMSGEIVERQELLNGTQTVTLEGVDATGAWKLAGSVSWNRGLQDYAGEGDITLAREDGAEVFGTLTRADLTAAADDEGDATLALTYDIDGGSGAFASASGVGTALLRLQGAEFQGTWRVEVRPPASDLT